MPSRPLIELAGVSKTYAASEGVVHALEGVSLDVPAGEFLSILGPSGCGKSTLLLMIAGLLAPLGWLAAAAVDPEPTLAAWAECMHRNLLRKGNARSL